MNSLEALLHPGPHTVGNQGREYQGRVSLVKIRIITHRSLQSGWQFEDDVRTRRQMMIHGPIGIWNSLYGRRELNELRSHPTFEQLSILRFPISRCCIVGCVVTVFTASQLVIQLARNAHLVTVFTYYSLPVKQKQHRSVTYQEISPFLNWPPCFRPFRKQGGSV